MFATIPVAQAAQTTFGPVVDVLFLLLVAGVLVSSFTGPGVWLVFTAGLADALILRPEPDWRVPAIALAGAVVSEALHVICARRWRGPRRGDRVIGLGATASGVLLGAGGVFMPGAATAGAAFALGALPGAMLGAYRWRKVRAYEYEGDGPANDWRDLLQRSAHVWARVAGAGGLAFWLARVIVQG